MKIYLCGPINGCTDDECNDWRSAIKHDWWVEQYCHRTIDPMRRDYRAGKMNQ